jgi:Xaa-Pro aminopeptidase
VPPDLGFLRESPLMDIERARSFLAREGFDALVLTHPANVYYATNMWPQLDSMGYINSMVAIVPRDPARPVAIVAHAFLYYYVQSDQCVVPGRAVYTFTQPEPSSGDATGEGDGSEPPASAPATLHATDLSRLTERERRRRAALAATRGNSATQLGALIRALRDLRLDGATLGVDDAELPELLAAKGIQARFRPGEQTVRRIRLAKSPTEIRLMRLAARQNAEAAVAAARAARELGSTRQLRARFFAEAAQRGNAGQFMVIDSSSAEVLDAPIRDGMAFSIDCVSTLGHYHGDFARTVFVGEPPAAVRRATDAVSKAWDDIRSKLRAGLRYSEVRRMGRESLARQGVDLNVSFTPHSVGLFHTDHPRASLVGGRISEDLVLEENMVLSVDCPPLEANLGGTVHLEDLTLIGASSGEPLNDPGNRVIVV